MQTASKDQIRILTLVAGKMLELGAVNLAIGYRSRGPAVYVQGGLPKKSWKEFSSMQLPKEAETWHLYFPKGGYGYFGVDVKLGRVQARVTRSRSRVAARLLTSDGRSSRPSVS